MDVDLPIPRCCPNILALVILKGNVLAFREIELSLVILCRNIIDWMLPALREKVLLYSEASPKIFLQRIRSSVQTRVSSVTPSVILQTRSGSLASIVVRIWIDAGCSCSALLCRIIVVMAGFMEIHGLVCQVSLDPTARVCSALFILIE